MDDVDRQTHFLASLLGDTKDGALDAGEGVAYINFQYNPDYVPPVWPSKPGQPQMMLHLDFEVSDLARAVERAVALGAEVCDFQPQANVRVLLDPAGHPFCLYTS